MGDDQISNVANLGAAVEEMINWIKDDTWPVPTVLCSDQIIDLFLRHIGSASTLGFAEKDLVRRLMEMLTTRILSKDMSGRHMEILGIFLCGLIDRDDYHMQLAVLGRSDRVKRGAPSKDEEVRWWATREVYEWKIGLGATDEAALKEAWDTWYIMYGGERTYTYEQAAGTNSKEVWPDGRPKTMYEQQVEMLKSRLNKAGSRTPAKRGRKPGIKKS